MKHSTVKSSKNNRPSVAATHSTRKGAIKSQFLTKTRNCLIKEKFIGKRQEGQ